MYGMVNQGIKDLIVGKFNEETWVKLCTEAKVPQDYVSMQYYDDSITYSLVAAASQMLQTPAEEILKIYGAHWIKYTSQTGYGPLMDMFGADFRSCLKNLNHLHARMGMTMPDLKPPQFVFMEINPHTYHVEYISDRAGLVPMVIGLLEALAVKYKQTVKIRELEKRSEKNHPLIEILIQEDV